jgi:hypothetical protein
LLLKCTIVVETLSVPAIVSSYTAPPPPKQTTHVALRTDDQPDASRK